MKAIIFISILPIPPYYAPLVLVPVIIHKLSLAHSPYLILYEPAIYVLYLYDDDKLKLKDDHHDHHAELADR